MKPIASSLFHRVIEPRRPSGERHPALFLLHGRGADEEDLTGLVHELDERLFVLSVRAPFPYGPGGGFTWYEFDPTGTPEPTMFGASYAKLVGFLRESVAGYPLDHTRLYLLGFSMGTVMTHALALTEPEMIRGISANSGYVPERTFLRFRWEALSHMDVLITHGTLDPVLPVQMGRRSEELYRDSTARLTYREYPMGHEITRESIDDIAGWLRTSLDLTPSSAAHG